MGSTYFHFNEIRKILRACVDEMYPMEKGMFVVNSNEIIQFLDVRFSRRVVKHIVEQRKADGKSIPEIKNMFDDVLLAIARFDFEMPNPNQRYPGSILRIKVLDERRGIVLVMDEQSRGGRDVVTAHPYRPVYIARLLKKKKLHTAAAGETPGPPNSFGGNPPIDHHPCG